MSDSMWIQGKEYISSKRASELSGYAQDYIGQLARKGLIAAQRVGGLWFVSMTSLTEYKSNADTYLPQLPEKKEAPDVDSLISFDGKDHISASRAAKITGYHPDYVGQLARSGAIISRQVGNRWYVDRAALLTHKKEKDGLLGAVQAQSVGLSAPKPLEFSSAQERVPEPALDRYSGPGPFLTYTRDDGDLLPVIEKSAPVSPPQEPSDSDEEHSVPIRVLSKERTLQHTMPVKRVKSRGSVHGKTIYYGTFKSLAAAALTIVIVLSFGFASFKNSSNYATGANPAVQRNMLASGAAAAIEWIGEFVQNFLVKELVYRRAE